MGSFRASRRSVEKPVSDDNSKNRAAPGLLNGLSILLVILVLIGIAFVWRQRAEAPGKLSVINAKIGSQHFVLDVSETPESRIKGLSGRQPLSKNYGMLFVYESPARQCIWMKDMNFSIDIIWIDANKTVTFIEPDVSPQTYPRTFCGGMLPSKYVIELNSGATADIGLKAGDKISF